MRKNTRFQGLVYWGTTFDIKKFWFWGTRILDFEVLDFKALDFEVQDNLILMYCFNEVLDYWNLEKIRPNKVKASKKCVSQSTLCRLYIDCRHRKY